ncbi:MAG: hypothetical protein ACR2LX_15330 [Jatrophihabitans sp.]
MPNFESFSRRMLSLKADPHITIHKRGTISLNRSAFSALGSPDAVELLFDREQSIVGLRAVHPKADNSYHVRSTSRSSGGPWVISAMAFTKFYEIDVSVSLRWPAQMDADILCADISGQGIPVSGNHAPKAN